MTDYIEPPEDIPNPYEQHLMFNQLFHDLEAIDSKRVDDFKEELDNSTIYIINPGVLK